MHAHRHDTNLPTDIQFTDKVKIRSTRKRKDQCRTSCEDIILEAATPTHQRGGSTSTKIDFHGDAHDEQHRATAAAAMRSVLEDDSSSASISPEALATSAVDALFHRRHEISEGDDPSQQPESPRLAESAPRTGMDTPSSSSSSSSATPSSSRAARPPYLPPLIETLVGAVDMDATPNDTKQDDDNGRPRQNLIRRPKDEKHSSRKSSLDSIIRGKDATTKAAAAAAATFWSSLQSRSRALVGRPNRMKNVNEEWDAALRWIAGWGKDELNADSAAVSTAKAKKADAFKRRSRIQSRKASKLGQSATKWDLVERLTAEEASELLLLIEMCVDKCVEMMAEDSEWSDKPKGRGSSIPSASSSTVTDRNGSGSGQTDVGSLPQSLFLLTLPHPFAAGILGLFLSSTLAYFLHMGYDWTLPWQREKEPSSEWVSSNMDYDDRVAMPSSKSGGKKGKRRKRQAKLSVSSPENEKKPASSKREELSRTRAAQISKSLSQNSLSDDDDANLVGLVRNTKRSSKSTSGNTPLRAPARTKIRGSTNNVSKKHLGASKYDSLSRQGSRQLKGKYRDSKSYQEKFPVPTEAQRHASHQQLREFQQIQLARWFR